MCKLYIRNYMGVDGTRKKYEGYGGGLGPVKLFSGDPRLRWGGGLGSLGQSLTRIKIWEGSTP